MLELGLARIGRLLSDSAPAWRSLHVAGTNGKGSVCAYASSMLQAAGVSYGRYTSPHLIDRWDCININGKTVDEGLFRDAEAQVLAKDKRENIKASEFELLTATAFKIFSQEKVKIGVLEVGLGGRLDATNILDNSFVTVITKIGKDHEKLLGNTLEAIAYQKAGIMRSGTPCLVDGTNPPEVLKVFADYAREIDAGPVIHIPQSVAEGSNQLWNLLPKINYEPHQQVNIALAFEATMIVLTRSYVMFNPVELAHAVTDTIWPGRLQLTSIKSLTGREQDVLLDGAHNPQSATVLASYVDRKIRRPREPVTWVIAASQGKDLNTMLPLLLRAGDNVVTVEFGPVEGMPWVEATSAKELLDIANGGVELNASCSMYDNVSKALQWATEIASTGPLVIAGSLYLVSDIMRLLSYSKNQ